MKKNLIQAKGGLHNRLTRQIALSPFSYFEVQEYFIRRHVKLSNYQLIELYMALGGIPHYLKEVEDGHSAAQAIDSICFAQDGLLREEFSRLYQALFDEADLHEQIVEILSTKRCGFTRNELIHRLGNSSGGTLTKTLDELIQYGFVAMAQPFQRKKKDALYYLADEFSMFHLRWMIAQNGSLASGEAYWQKNRVRLNGVLGVAMPLSFSVFKHMDWIKEKLGVAAVDTDCCGWRYAPKDPEEFGDQVDLLIDQEDETINMCEIKFSNTEFVIDKVYAKELRNKLEVFDALQKHVRM
jgi:hypothetical protein